MNAHHRKANLDCSRTSFSSVAVLGLFLFFVDPKSSFGLGVLRKPWLKHFVLGFSKLESVVPGGSTIGYYLSKMSVHFFSLIYISATRSYALQDRSFFLRYCFFIGKNWGTSMHRKINHLSNYLMLTLLLVLCLLWLKNMMAWFWSKPVFINIEGTILQQEQNVSSRISCLFTFLYVHKDWAIGQYDPVSF